MTPCCYRVLGRANNRFFGFSRDRARRWELVSGLEKEENIFFKNCVRTIHYTTTNTKKKASHTNNYITHKYLHHIPIITSHITHYTISTCPYAKLLTPSFNTNRLSSKHNKEILQISYVPILFPFANILFIQCLTTFSIKQHIFKFTMH